uniref:Solute carrier family 25 member 46 n=1 Tax=Strongyloides stercoralis TaxID=6248 RepID=A0A0K0DS92_STRER
MSGDNAPRWRYRTRPDPKSFNRIPIYDDEEDDDSNDSDDSIKLLYNSVKEYKKPVISKKDRKDEVMMEEDTSYQNTIPSTVPLETTEETFYNNILGSLDVGLRFLIRHPCNVIRRQCQVHQFAKSLHLQPFTLLPVICRSISNDGFMSLWKGSIGSAYIYGISSLVEIVVSDVFNLPHKILSNDTTRRYWRHIGMKAISFAVIMPFHISAFIETVRSRAGLSPGDYRITEVLTNGIDRLKYDIIGPRDNSRRFSIFYLSIPGTLYYTAHYMITLKSYNVIHEMVTKYVMRKKASERTLFHKFLPKTIASLTSIIVADALLYPFETILHRLYIQGTRTLIDNMDTGASAISISAKYLGIKDCIQQMWEKEHKWVFLSGIGALMLQTGLQLSLLKCTRYVLEYGTKTPNSTPDHVHLIHRPDPLSGEARL